LKGLVLPVISSGYAQLHTQGKGKKDIQARYAESFLQEKVGSIP